MSRNFRDRSTLRVETRFKIAEIYKATHDEARYHEAAAADRQHRCGGRRRANKSHAHLAARSALVLAEQLYEQFARCKLVQPFESSLQEKQRRMDAAIEVARRARRLPGRRSDRSGDVLHGRGVLRLQPLADRIGAPDRPARLRICRNTSSRWRKTAFPFEEKAIGVHEKNLELIRSGIYNAWIEKSLAKLAQLMPARYAKSEMSSGFLGSIDSYAYRAPSAPAVGIGAVDGDKATQGDAREPDIASAQGAVDAPQSGAAVTAAGASNAIAH